MGSDSANMKQSGQFVLILAIFGLVSGQNQDNCHTYAAGVCRDSTDLWSSQGSSCNAVYGNIAGNKHNLGKLMTDNLKQSFQFIAMVIQFLEKELMGDYHTDVRLISGQLNVLGKMAKHQNSRNMGLHLFDKNL